MNNDDEYVREDELLLVIIIVIILGVLGIIGIQMIPNCGGRLC